MVFCTSHWLENFNNVEQDIKLIFISNLGKLRVCYNNFWRSDEGVRLQCEFDIAAGVSAEDTKDSF